jgi:bifunctional UDP-N-acetylglucosamine pyrophosphorylase / glucosamine-1-phosphate N-acetyltransferase
VILAAGQGKRMRSSLPKVLHPLAGTPLLEHVVRAARHLEPSVVHVVHGHGGERVRAALDHLDLAWVEQARQLGTGHAVAQVLPAIPDGASVLVLYGDVPLVEPASLGPCVRLAGEGNLALMTIDLDDPSGYGRIVRDEGGRVVGIVEERDASPDERLIREINTGILAAPAAALRTWIADLSSDNAQDEYYLTDVVGMAVAQGMPVRTVHPGCLEEVLGVNDRAQLANLERWWQRREAERLMAQGATVADPARLDVRGEVTVAPDVFLDVNVVLEGRVVLGEGVRIGPGACLRDVEVGAGTEVLAHSVLEEASIGTQCRIGPFARIRPGSRLGRGVHVGNFVEVKNTLVGDGSKANHLTYLGDAEIGRGVNVGAGTITCNYDGSGKHRTFIEDEVFIGSGVELVAPVVLRAGATIGAGSTITKEAPPDALTVARARQTTVRGWRRPARPKPR